MSVTAARGFVAGGAACGIKESGAPDLAIVATEDRAAVPAAGVFTTNLACAAPVQISREHLTNGHAANGSGNGHASNGNGGSTASPTITLNLGATKVSFQTQADAPSCMDCGSIMVRNGSCYKCLNCGSTSGCS